MSAAATPTARRPRGKAAAAWAGHVGTYVLLYGLAALTLAPFLWMVLTSFKDIGEIFSYPPTWWPERFSLDNYVDAFSAAPFGRFYFNSLLVAVTVTLGQLVTCSLAAYAFARMEFRGRDVLFYVFLGTMMVPAHVTMIPSFMILHGLGLVDTYGALIVPGLASAFGTFLLRQFFLGLPRELEEAAFMDGAGRFRVLWQIVLPLAKPALATLAVFTFMGVFNDFIWALIVINSQELYTVQLGLAIFRDRYSTEWGSLMAGSVVATLPILLLFLVAQKHFIQGIALSGLKD